MVKKVSDHGIQIEEKRVINETRNSSRNRSGGTPMKMLIAKEMSREKDNFQKPPTVVARLMGLESFPAENPTTIAQRFKTEVVDHSFSSTSDTAWSHMKQENTHRDRLAPCRYRDQPFVTPDRHRTYKDVYEVWEEPSCIGLFNDGVFPREIPVDSSIEKRMSVVRQKFMEAKRLATNDKLLHSKEFQDALEVLSSNRDLFLEILEEPGSLLSTNTKESQPISTSVRPKCITVLKPSTTIDMGAGKVLKPSTTIDMGAGKVLNQEKSHIFHPFHQEKRKFSGRTRIVVLKPMLGELSDEKLTSASPDIPEKRCLFDEIENEEVMRSREVAKEIAQKMRESLSSNNMDETMVSVLSNGYIGDESSFNRSDDEFLDVESDILSESESEVVTPTSCQSWDHASGLDNPCSDDYFRHNSFSSGSSLKTEAKKRLSERLVKMASNQMNQDGQQEWENTNTLGEMLASFNINNERKNKVRPISTSRSIDMEHDLMMKSFDMHNSVDRVEGHARRPLNLQRSQSLPSSPLYEKRELNIEGTESQVATSNLFRNEERSKAKSGKSLFKEKVSKFFFSRNKKFAKEKPSSSLSSGQNDRSYYIAERNSQRSDGQLHCSAVYNTRENPSYDYERLAVADRQNQMITSLEQHLMFENVLEKEEFHAPKLEQAFKNVSLPHDDDARQRTISRSPPIESVARSLRHEGIYSGRIGIKFSKYSTNFLKADVEEKERLGFVQSLLSSAGLGTETSSTFLARWHSLESPLNPALLEKLLENKEWANCPEKRSNQRLLFDCVNAALLEISWTTVLSIDWLRISSWNPTTNSVTEDVQRRIKELFSNDKLLSFSYGDINSLEVDNFVRKEVSGKRWSEMMGSEIAEIGMLIEGQVLEELLSEALGDFISGWLQ